MQKLNRKDLEEILEEFEWFHFSYNKMDNCLYCDKYPTDPTLSVAVYFSPSNLDSFVNILIKVESFEKMWQFTGLIQKSNMAYDLFLIKEREYHQQKERVSAGLLKSMLKIT